jgi:acetylornithine deacetylase
MMHRSRCRHGFFLPGSIEQAHKPDEFIERVQLAECEQFLDRLIRRQCG